MNKNKRGKRVDMIYSEKKIAASPGVGIHVLSRSSHTTFTPSLRTSYTLGEKAEALGQCDNCHLQIQPPLP